LWREIEFSISFLGNLFGVVIRCSVGSPGFTEEMCAEALGVTASLRLRALISVVDFYSIAR